MITQQTKSLIKKLTIPSVIIWLVPFVVGFLFYDKNGQMVGDYWVFKVAMIISATGAAWYMLRNFFRKNKEAKVVNSSIIIGAFQVLLDLIVLIGLLKMDTQLYLTTVLPVYFVLVPLTNYVLIKTQR